MDTYTKAILTAIAAGVWCLVVLAVFERTPTIGDLREVGEIDDDQRRDKLRKELLHEVPLVRQIGG